MIILGSVMSREKQEEWKRTQIRIPENLYDEVTRYADKNDLSFNSAMLELMEKGLQLKTDLGEIVEEFSQQLIQQKHVREELAKKYLPHTRIENAAYSENEGFIAIRYKESNTSQNCRNLLDYLNMPECIQVVLFATSDKPNNGYSRNDGPETNLPLMGALALVELHNQKAYVIFDGLFLTAQRYPRYKEVKAILDSSISSNKAYFINEPVPFTSSWNPVNAVSQLIHYPKQKLTLDTRSQYYRLLSHYSEKEFEDIYNS